MKKLVVFCICTIASIAHAQTNTCLEKLRGKFFYQIKNVSDHVFTIQFANNSWQFKRPDNPEADMEKIFRYSFDKSKSLPAKPIPTEQISLLGSAVLTQYLDKPEDMKGVRYECGLITDDFYLVNIDLSNASPQLVKNMVMMKKASEGNKDYNSQPTSKEIDEMRKQKYFSGQPFKLEGVTNGVVSFMLQKQ